MPCLVDESTSSETGGDTVAEEALTGTATSTRGLRAKALLPLNCASTMLKVLLCMLLGKIGQANRSLSSWRIGACCLVAGLLLPLSHYAEAEVSTWMSCDREERSVVRTEGISVLSSECGTFFFQAVTVLVGQRVPFREFFSFGICASVRVHGTFSEDRKERPKLRFGLSFL